MSAGFARRWLALVCLWVGAGWVFQPKAWAQEGGQAEPLLVRIDVAEPPVSFPLPVHARLQDATGRNYVLVKAPPDDLARSGLAFQILDAGDESAVHILAYEFRPGARAAAQGGFRIVHDDGRRLIIRSSAGDDVDALADLGFQCRFLSSKPLDLGWSLKRAPLRRRFAVDRNATVAAMIAQVGQPALTAALEDLTGIRSVFAEGSEGAIRTRHQNSGIPLQRATALAHERLGAVGLRAEYHAWAAGGRSNRNVIGTRAGTSLASEIVVVCAHIDDLPASGDAPGADDNASGSVAVLEAARILGSCDFRRTIRFVLFTGEEQGLLGSEVYAADADDAGDNIVAALNLDMVAWDGNDDRVLNLYVRPGSGAGAVADRSIAATFTNVVRQYGIGSGLDPEIVAEEADWSDHYSFSRWGYPSICAIEEDEEDFNPHYHTSRDTLDKLNLPFYTRVVQAVIGTVAHLAEPVIAGSSLGVSPVRRVHSPVAASGLRISVSAAQAWTATSRSAWISITSGARGAGGGRVTYRVAANGGAGARTGAIVIRSPGAAGSPKTVKVVQGGRRIPLLQVAPEVRRRSSSRGRTTFTVVNKGGGTLRYRAREWVPWLWISNGSRGTNRGTFEIRYSENSSTRSRTGTVAVAATGANFSPVRVKIVQAGQP